MFVEVPVEVFVVFAEEGVYQFLQLILALGIMMLALLMLYICLNIMLPPLSLFIMVGFDRILRGFLMRILLV
jgi:hypothetical protein